MTAGTTFYKGEMKMDFLVKRGRGLDPAVLQWLMATLGVGPGIGDVHFLVKVDSAYYSWLRDDLRVNPSKIHYSLAAGEDALVASRNDCLLVYPGAYDETAELAWDKANTHLMGLGGPNIGGDWSEPNVVLYSDETDCASVLTVTGANSQFHNFVVSNYGNDAACLTAATCNIYGTRWKNVAFQGVMTAGNDDTVAAASLYIGGAGMYPVFEDCVIGQDVWDAREGANSGMLRFTGIVRPNGGIFKRCRFLSRSVTATAALVALPVNTCIGRGWVFEDCHFSNFYDGTTLLNQVFYTVTGTQQLTVQLKNCTMVGFSSWQDGTFNIVYGDMPIAEKSGGRMLQMSET